MKSNELIRYKRKEMGMTMKDVADRIGVSEATVSRWESGSVGSMKRQNVAALARLFDLSPAVLMDWEEYEEENATRKMLIRDLTELAEVSSAENIEIVLNLLRKLEGKA